MTEECKKTLESELENLVSRYIRTTDEDEGTKLLKRINSVRKILEDNEKHEQEIRLKESRSQVEKDRIRLDVERNAIESRRLNLEMARDSKNDNRQEKTDKREFWLRIASIAVPAVGGLAQLAIGHLQYCGLVNMIYHDSERPTPEMKDAIKFTKNAIFRK